MSGQSGSSSKIVMPAGRTTEKTPQGCSPSLFYYTSLAEILQPLISLWRATDLRSRSLIKWIADDIFSPKMLGMRDTLEKHTLKKALRFPCEDKHLTMPQASSCIPRVLSFPPRFSFNCFLFLKKWCYNNTIWNRRLRKGKGGGLEGRSEVNAMVLPLPQNIFFLY